MTMTRQQNSMGVPETEVGTRKWKMHLRLWARHWNGWSARVDDAHPAARFTSIWKLVILAEILQSRFRGPNLWLDERMQREEREPEASQSVARKPHNLGRLFYKLQLSYKLQGRY